MQEACECLSAHTYTVTLTGAWSSQHWHGPFPQEENVPLYQGISPARTVIYSSFVRPKTYLLLSPAIHAFGFLANCIPETSLTWQSRDELQCRIFPGSLQQSVGQATKCLGSRRQ